jgi:hypothetical protein
MREYSAFMETTSAVGVRSFAAVEGEVGVVGVGVGDDVLEKMSWGVVEVGCVGDCDVVVVVLGGWE